MPDIPSLHCITSAHGVVELAQEEEDYFVVIQNRNNSQISSNTNKNENSRLIFGEEAFSEDNILQHYFFNKTNQDKHRSYNKFSPVLRNSLYTRAP